VDFRCGEAKTGPDAIGDRESADAAFRKPRRLILEFDDKGVFIAHILTAN
jgi:hypothetical protein